MIQLKLRSEYSLRYAYGKLQACVDHCAKDGAMALTDRNSTFGHVKFQKMTKKAGIKPIFGVELGIFKVLDDKSRAINWITLLAKNQKGLKKIYEMVELSTKQFYYYPRLQQEDLLLLDENVILLLGNNPQYGLINSLKDITNCYQDVSPSTNDIVRIKSQSVGIALVATSDNTFILPEDRPIYEIIVDRNAERNVTSQHIVDK